MAELAQILEMLRARQMTRPEACALLGLTPKQLRIALRRAGIRLKTGRIPKGRGGRDSAAEREALEPAIEMSEPRLDQIDAKWREALKGRHFDAFAVSRDPRRLPASETFVPTMSPLVTR